MAVCGRFWRWGRLSFVHYPSRFSHGGYCLLFSTLKQRLYFQWTLGRIGSTDLHRDLSCGSCSYLSLSLSLFKTKIKFKNNIPPSPKIYKSKNKKIVYSLGWIDTLIRFYRLQTLQTALVETLRMSLLIMILSIPWHCPCLTWLYISVQQWNWMGVKVKMCMCVAGSMAQEFPEIHKIYYLTDFQPNIYRQVHRSTLQAQRIPIYSPISPRAKEISPRETGHRIITFHNIPLSTFRNRTQGYHRNPFPKFLWRWSDLTPTFTHLTKGGNTSHLISP